jgi:hypothetical protein
MSHFGDFEHEKVSVGNYIPNIWVQLGHLPTPV